MIESRVVVLDGATGTNLQKAGMTQKQDDKGALDRPTGFGSLEESK